MLDDGRLAGVLTRRAIGSFVQSSSGKLAPDPFAREGEEGGSA